ncbi:hypothetical protein GQ55_4G294800 [Panicum hallii var. hallii]|uniref:Uncharacterized protein n=1 Tax=Panicum hallii var. hallii TaxID=1504633 RepID=A0A2T7E1G0_9POAL|nr:hypothetical protein GQ55_4G294800 [Panicum hallii var. hallii]
MHGDRRPWQLHQHAHRAPNRSQMRGRQSEARPHCGGHRRRKTSSTQASCSGRRRGRSTPPPWLPAAVAVAVGAQHGAPRSPAASITHDAVRSPAAHAALGAARRTPPPGRQPPPPWAQHATPRPSLP